MDAAEMTHLTFSVRLRIHICEWLLAKALDWYPKADRRGSIRIALCMKAYSEDAIAELGEEGG